MFRKGSRLALHVGLVRRGISRAQARRDREWRQFVRDLTEPTRQLSPAEDERMLLFLESHSSDGDERSSEPPVERAA